MYYRYVAVLLARYLQDINAWIILPMYYVLIHRCLSNDTKGQTRHSSWYMHWSYLSLHGANSWELGVARQPDQVPHTSCDAGSALQSRKAPIMVRQVASTSVQCRHRPDSDLAGSLTSMPHHANP